MSHAERITIEVVVGDRDVPLDIEWNGDESFSMTLDGKELCRGGWQANLRPALERILSIWPKED